MIIKGKLPVHKFPMLGDLAPGELFTVPGRPCIYMKTNRTLNASITIVNQDNGCLSTDWDNIEVIRVKGYFQIEA